jgi:SAM-dependent methyltransferase
VRFLLLHSIVIKPGLETVDPHGAVGRYRESLQARQTDVIGKRILVFGYGGRFDTGVELLEAGAGFVALCDRFARPDDRHNAGLMTRYGAYMGPGERAPRPNPQVMQLVEADVRALPAPEEGARFDLVLSNSVYEHVEDAAGVTRALAAWTKPSGLHIHFVDLRDHFFEYPFEMLKFSEPTWRRLLNPTSNHNRLRLWEYRTIFEAHFGHVDIDVLARDQAAFERALPGLRPEFVSGNPAEDSVTLIRIAAWQPLH